jgi:citrate synthase
MPDTLTITDNRTGRTYELPITDDTVRAADLRKVRVAPEDFGLMAYDPALVNTAACRSTITFIDGDRGILRYRGYPIEQLAEQSTFLETAWLVLYGELPSKAELERWTRAIHDHRVPPARLAGLFGGLADDPHPMGALIAAFGALGTFYPESHDIHDAETRRRQIYRIIGQAPALAAYAARARKGEPIVPPAEGLSFAGNFLHMLRATAGTPFTPNPVLERALDILFILHVDHEQNCSTFAMRSVGSSNADPYSSVAAASAALYGPLHGGANEAVLRMLHHIGSLDKVPQFIKSVKGGEGRLMGFGHRIYKSYDPRARIIKRVADEVFEVTGKNPLLEIAQELERIALQDDYFVKRKLYPNVDFYSGLIYEAMGFPADMFTVLFAIPRTAGWLAQWEEMLNDPETKIVRPRQIYVGADQRAYVPVEKRS